MPRLLPQVTQLTRLVDDLSMAAYHPEGVSQLKREPLDLATVIKFTRSKWWSRCSASGSMRSPSSQLSRTACHGDMARLVQCVGQTLDHAAKYTDAAGRSAWQTRAEDGCALVEISDTGARYFFGPSCFRGYSTCSCRVTENPRRSLGGLGIGLSVARQLVEMHGASWPRSARPRMRIDLQASALPSVQRNFPAVRCHHSRCPTGVDR